MGTWLLKLIDALMARFYPPAPMPPTEPTIAPEPTQKERETPVEQASEYGSVSAEQLYLKAKSFLGVDLTPKDEVPDYVACVAQFQALHFKTFGRYVGTGAALYNTQAIRDALGKDLAYVSVPFAHAKPGDVCVFASNESFIVKHGHIFVVGKVNWMSNNSETGQWSAHKTRQQVEDYYITYARFLPYVFRPL